MGCGSRFDAFDRGERDAVAEALARKEAEGRGFGLRPSGVGEGCGEERLCDWGIVGGMTILDVACEGAERHREVVGLGTLGEGESEVGRTGDLASQEEGEHLDHLDGRDGGRPREQAFGSGIVGSHGGGCDEHEVAPTSGPEVVALVGREWDGGGDVARMLER